MSMDLSGITFLNEYYTNHYLSSLFEENTEATISGWRNRAKEEEEYKTPWSSLRECAKQFYPVMNKYKDSSKESIQALQDIKDLADSYIAALGYPEAKEFNITVDEQDIPVYLEITKSNGAPLLWVVLAHGVTDESTVMNSRVFSTKHIDTDTALFKDTFVNFENEDLISKLLFGNSEPPRFLMIITLNQIALIDREKWNAKRYIQFELETIFGRREETTLQAMAVLLHKESTCPNDGKILLDTLSDNSQRHASGVSQDLKYALRESIELLGNEVLYFLATEKNISPEDVDAGQLTLECLRYMYRMLFVLFIEARPELGFAPIREQTYFSGYSLESLRDIADNIRDDVDEVGDGYYLHETLSKLYDMIYTGYPEDKELYNKAMRLESKHDMFIIHPLKAHIFDPEYTPTLKDAKIRNRVMLHIVDLMSLTKASGKKNARRGRISYANLGINQMGAVYEALLSYRGFIAKEDLYEVKAKGEKVDDLDVGYFVPERELDQYDEDERVRLDDDKTLRVHKKGEFIYRLAGREREKSASYYTPECLTQCLVKYALKELLKDKTADDILKLTICEPAMGSAAFLNEAINQLAEAYLDKKQKETGETVASEKRQTELQKIKMYIADNNVYGIDLNPVAVELAEVSLWLNTIYEGGYVPWFGAQLVNGNSLIGARRQGYAPMNLTATSKNLRWFEMAPERIPFGRSAAQKNRIYHFLLGDPGMCSYSDKVIKSLAPDGIKMMTAWNKEFNKPYSDEDIITLKELSKCIDTLWKQQISDRKLLQSKTRTELNVFGQNETESNQIPMSIREKDKYLRMIYKSEAASNVGAYARLKFAMDYWCALWFWPIDKAEELPSRSEFFMDMDMILKGVMETTVSDGQMSLFGDNEETEESVRLESVNLAQLCKQFPRLQIAKDIADANKFMHWELEFAEIFADRGGFDLTIGNPPWIKLEWNEQGVLSDKKPILVVKKLTATQVVSERTTALKDESAYSLYFGEYEAMSGQQAFMNSTQNYPDLKGQQTNLFKCFLPQSWQFGTERSVSAFIHPEGVYDDPKGQNLREKVYSKLKYHFQFKNELTLFREVDHHTVYGLNVYKNDDNCSFDSISNLFDVSTIDECYITESINIKDSGIKDKYGKWNLKGSKDRIIHVTPIQLKLFSKLFENEIDTKGPKFLSLHHNSLLNVIEKMSDCDMTVGKFEGIFISEMWNETGAQKDGIIIRKTDFPNKVSNLIMNGSHIGICNPFAKTPREICLKNSDYDVIDLKWLPDNYLPRSNYIQGTSDEEYRNKIPVLQSGIRYDENYRIFARKMIDPEGTRTLIATLVPPLVAHTSGITGITFNSNIDLLITLGCFSSLPIDYLLKSTAKSNFQSSTIKNMPVVSSNSLYAGEIIYRVLRLNCISKSYAAIWNECIKTINYTGFSKKDNRLIDLIKDEEWNENSFLRTDYSRRQALVEIDVLVAMALGFSLDELISILNLQFYLVLSQENETWYDSNGRIVFTNNRSLIGVGFDRKQWESEIKGAEAGKKFYRTITDDTQPGGPVERTIEYVAPFDRCDREKDYETAWEFFEGKNKT